jgi:hypothetical protein
LRCHNRAVRHDKSAAASSDAPVLPSRKQMSRKQMSRKQMSRKQMSRKQMSRERAGMP